MTRSQPILPVSEAQERAMHAAAEGHSNLGIPKKVGEEFVGKAHDLEPNNGVPLGRWGGRANPHKPPAQDAREGQRVKILGGMREFVGKTGTIVMQEGNMYRVRLDSPVDIPGVGKVRDDLWEGNLLRKVG